MQAKQYSKYIFFLLLVLLLYLSYRVIEPYLVAIVTAGVLAILFHPVYVWLEKKTGRRIVSGLIVVLIVLLIAAVPLAFVLQAIISEATNAVDYLRNEFGEEIIFDWNCENKTNIGCDLHQQITILFPEFDLKQSAIDAGRNLLSLARNALESLSKGLLHFVIALYIMFFLLIDGRKLLKVIKQSLALRPSYEKYITNILSETINGVVFGNIISALVQGVIAGIGYWLIGGLGSTVLLGLLTAFFALIPSVGTTIIWLPAGLYLLASGWISDSGGLIIRGILLLAYGALIVSTIDNILKPKLIGDRAKIHPAVVLVGVLGGLSLMGLIGLIVGPLVLALFISFTKLLVQERKNL